MTLKPSFASVVTKASTLVSRPSSSSSVSSSDNSPSRSETPVTDMLIGDPPSRMTSKLNVSAGSISGDGFPPTSSPANTVLMSLTRSSTVTLVSVLALVTLTSTGSAPSMLTLKVASSLNRPKIARASWVAVRARALIHSREVSSTATPRSASSVEESSSSLTGAAPRSMPNVKWTDPSGLRRIVLSLKTSLSGERSRLKSSGASTSAKWCCSSTWYVSKRFTGS